MMINKVIQFLIDNGFTEVVDLVLGKVWYKGADPCKMRALIYADNGDKYLLHILLDGVFVEKFKQIKVVISDTDIENVKYAYKKIEKHYIKALKQSDRLKDLLIKSGKLSFKDGRTLLLG